MPIDVKRVQGLYFICQEVQQKLGCVNFQALLTLFSLCSQETQSKVRGQSELSAVWSFVLVLYTVWCSHSGQGWRGGGVKDSYEAALPEPHSLTPAAALCVSASCLMQCERCRWTRGQDHVQGRSSCWIQNSSSSSQYMIWSMKLDIKETSCSLICPLHRSEHHQRVNVSNPPL